MVIGELKLSFNLDLVLQALDRTAACDEVWLAVGAAGRGRLRDPRVRLGLGSDGNRQDALRKKIFGVARVVGSGHVDFDTLTEVVPATIPSGRRAWGTARSEDPSGIPG